MSTVFNIKANDKECQKKYQEQTKGKYPNGRVNGVTQGTDVVFSEISAKQDTFSEEFLHLFQLNAEYKSNPRPRQKLDAEAQIFNGVVGLEVESASREGGSVTRVMNSIKTSTPSVSYSCGNLNMLFDDLRTSGSLVIQKGTPAWNSYLYYINNYSGNHNQSNNVSGGVQRELIPAAYNSVVNKFK